MSEMFPTDTEIVRYPDSPPLAPEKAADYDPASAETLVSPGRRWFIGNTLAFALNDGSIEMAAARTIGPKVWLQEAQKLYIPSSRAQEADKWAFVTEAVREFINQFGTRHSRICLSLSSSETCFRTFYMPDLSARQLASAVVFEVKKQLPFPIAECNYDYRVVSRSRHCDKREAKIALVAATKRLVQRVSAPIENAGCRIDLIYNSPEAMGQLLEYLPGFKSEASFGLVNIERDRTQLAYYRGTSLLFYHYSSVGSSVIASRSDPRRFEDFAQLLSAEIQNSLDYYSGQFSTHFTNKVFIHGDLAYADELVEQLKSHLGFDFCRFPAEELSFVSARHRQATLSLTACLQAIAAATCSFKVANLLPPEKVKAAREKTSIRFASASLFIIAAVLLGSWGLNLRMISSAQEELNAINQTISQFQESEIAQELEQAKSQLTLERAYLAGAEETQSYYGYNLKELSRLTPAAIELQMLEADGQSLTGANLRLAGVVKSSSTPPEILLADYVDQLEASSYYSNVEVKRYRKKSVSTGFELEFELNCWGVL